MCTWTHTRRHTHAHTLADTRTHTRAPSLSLSLLHTRHRNFLSLWHKNSSGERQLIISPKEMLLSLWALKRKAKHELTNGCTPLVSLWSELLSVEFINIELFRLLPQWTHIFPLGQYAYHLTSFRIIKTPLELRVTIIISYFRMSLFYRRKLWW